jgi:DNA-binding transcriptional ArsR family regulator
VRVLISTFGEGDAEKMVLAMRSLPYDRLVLVGESGSDRSEDFRRIRDLESMSGHQLDYEELRGENFSERADEFCELILRYARSAGTGSEISLNISGGTKLLGDIALLSAFRIGIPAYYAGERMVRLPVMAGVAAVKRFTPLQARFVKSLREEGSVAEVADRMGGINSQSVERLMREMKKAGIVDGRLESGKVVISLTSEGVEAAKTLEMAERAEGL